MSLAPSGNDLRDVSLTTEIDVGEHQYNDNTCRVITGILHGILVYLTNVGAGLASAPQGLPLPPIMVYPKIIPIMVQTSLIPLLTGH